MSHIVGQEMATSPEETLAHYGKKGMKWGVTTKPTKSEIIDARVRVIGKNVQYGKDRKAIKKSDATRSEKRASLAELKVSALADPDRMTALRMTSGEKAAMAVLTVGFAPSAAAVAVNRAAVKRTLTNAQKKQASKQSG